MGKKHPYARYVLPGTVNPSDTVCIQVEVPNDRYHIAAFMGQIYALASASQWQNDDAHTAIEVAKVWWSVFNNLKTCGGLPINSGADEGIENMIRQNPANPCLLETSINGTDWCVFADLSKCVPDVHQPGSGTPQPPAGGGQACYHANLSGNGKWLLPTLVNTGDVISVSNEQGSASDGTVVWYCPSGAIFQLGACFGSGSTSSGDPLNTVPHMRLIAKIGSNYYDMHGASFTVPGGVTAASVEFQLNDSNIADNYGSISFDVCVTNNMSATFVHTFDFTLGDGGWAAWTPPIGIGAVYTPGVGWTNSDFQNPSGNYYRSVIIQRSFASRTITQIRMIYDIASRASNQSGINPGETYIYSGLATGVLQNLNWNSESNGTGKVYEWNGSTALTGMAVQTWSSYNVTSGGYAGSCKISKVVVSGVGTDPF